MAEKVLSLLVSVKDQTAAGFAAVETKLKNIQEKAHHSVREFKHMAVAIEGIKVVTEGAKAGIAGYHAYSAYIKGDTEEWARQMKEVDESLKKLPLGLGEVYSLGQDIRDVFTGEKEELKEQEEQTKKLNKLLEEQKKITDEIRKANEETAKIKREAVETYHIEGKSGDEKEKATINKQFDDQIAKINESKHKIEEELRKGQPNITTDKLAVATQEQTQAIMLIERNRREAIKKIDSDSEEKFSKFYQGNRKQLSDLSSEALEAAARGAGNTVEATKLQVGRLYDDLIASAKEKAEELRKETPSKKDAIDSEEKKTITALSLDKDKAIATALAEVKKKGAEGELAMNEKILALQKQNISEIDTAGNADLERQKQKLLLQAEYAEKQEAINKLLLDPQLSRENRAKLHEEEEGLALRKKYALDKLDHKQELEKRQTDTKESRFGSNEINAELNPLNKQINLSEQQLAEQKAIKIQLARAADIQRAQQQNSVQITMYQP